MHISIRVLLSISIEFHFIFTYVFGAAVKRTIEIESIFLLCFFLFSILLNAQCIHMYIKFGDRHAFHTYAARSGTQNTHTRPKREKTREKIVYSYNQI